jgi:hypothetical protein
MTSIFLPVTEASSVMLRLDLAFENFSTLENQKAAIREMWPLAHIVSVFASIYALYPQENDRSDSPTTNFWQEAPLLALQRVQRGKPTQDTACICHEINRVLMESIRILNTQVTAVSSSSLVLLVYHTMSIHFLFPVLPQEMAKEAMTSDLMDRFCASTQEILQTFATISEQPRELFSHIPILRSSLPDVFTLALDTCARALTLLNGKREMGNFRMDIGRISIYESTVATLAHRLYSMSQNDLLSQTCSLRLVTKHLRSCVRAFSLESSSASVSSGMCTPDYHSPSDDLDMSDLQAACGQSQDVLNPDAVSREQLGVSNVVNLQNACFPQMLRIMEFDPSGDMSGLQWDWTDMDTDQDLT